MRGNISMMPSLSIAWPRCFPQAVGQQHFGADGFKTVSASHALRQLYQSVQAFGVPGGVAVSEVVENGVPVALNGQRQRQESFVDIKGDICQPCKVAFQGGCFCLGLVDVVKRLFEMVGGFQSGKVFQPYFNDQGVAFIQVAGASQQQEPIMHQCSPLLVCEAFANFFTDSFQASREQLEHVKLVYNQFGMWQNLMYRIMIASPHIRTHDGDMLFYGIGQALQVTDHRGFGALSKQVNDLVVGNIGDHTSVLMQQIQFVNAQVEHFSVWNTRLKVCREFAKESTDGTLSQTNFVSDAHKGSSQCFLLDVGNQAIGHEMAFIHAWERLEEGAAASTTAIAMSLHGDPDALAPDRQVHEELWLDFMAVEMWVMAMGTARGRRKTLRLDMEVMFVFVYRQNANACQSENIQEPLSPQIVLHKKFSAVAVVPVARERRIQRAYSTHFRDVALLCWSVKNETIPRGIAISRNVFTIGIRQRKEHVSDNEGTLHAPLF